MDPTKSTITKTEMYPPIVIPAKSSRELVLFQSLAKGLMYILKHHGLLYHSFNSSLVYHV